MNYNKCTVAVVNFYNTLSFYDIDCSHIDGVKGVIAEMVVRVISGNSYVNRDSFRRTCKRHSCSQKVARKALRQLGLIGLRDSFTYGCGILDLGFEMRTFEQWVNHGYCVNKGETSYIKCGSSGNCLFTSIQVSKRRNYTVLGENQNHKSQLPEVKQPKRHPKCLGYEINTPDYRDFDCGYNTSITCDDCKYGGHGGRKNPEAKRNQG